MNEFLFVDFVNVEPAAIIDDSPISIGAIKLLLQPMNEEEPIIVLYLFLPS